MPEFPISFEVYPPKTPDAAPALYEAIDRLSELGPRFISVTFGAGGSETKASLEVLNYIKSRGVTPLAHLTCAGTTRDQALDLVTEFLAAGIEDFLALRGDLPTGATELSSDSLQTASELVELISPMQSAGSMLAVAAFPNGHPESGSARADLDALLAKQAAGANLAITQLFFYASDYRDFVELAGSRGVTLPILPGVMPITSASRLERVLQLTGEQRPTEFAELLALAPDAAARVEVGINWAANQVAQLKDLGAPGIHLYAFNEHLRVTEVLRRALVI